MEWLGIISGVASIIGCVISVLQACKAKKYANKVQDLATKISSRNEVDELDKIEILLKKAIHSIEKFSRSPDPESISGLDFNKTRKHIENYLLEIKKNSLILKYDNTNICENHCVEIELLFSQYDSGKESLFIVAKSIRSKLTDFYKYVGKWKHDNENTLIGLPKQ